MFQEYFNNFPTFENLFFPFLHDHWPAGLASEHANNSNFTLSDQSWWALGLLGCHSIFSTEGDGVGGTGQPLNDSSEPLESNDDRRR
jgi:hypothetical protein